MLACKQTCHIDLFSNVGASPVRVCVCACFRQAVVRFLKYVRERLIPAQASVHTHQHA